MFRRQVLGGALGVFGVACASPRAPRSSPSSFASIEARVGGRIGVYALDTATERSLAHRADERFAMCSTFKWALAAAVLARDDLPLDGAIPYAESDLLDHAPAARAHLSEGAMTARDLARAAVVVSDNTAANLLLAKIGGPAGLTRFVRAAGDGTTRLDRDEPGLNENTPGDPRDTTSPRAMVGLMRAVLCGDVLPAERRALLVAWMRACETGRERLRAGLPPDWIVGDKTGTGRRGAVNDVAIAWPPGRAPILVAAYTSDGESAVGLLAAAHVAIARVVATQL